MSNTHPRKAELDQWDDGKGPYMERDNLFVVEPPKYWDDFKAWASDRLGQGYSLACVDGGLVDEVTFWAYRAYRAGRNECDKCDGV